MGWPSISLSEISEINPKSPKIQEFKDESIVFLPMKNIGTNGMVDTSEVIEFSEFNPKTHSHVQQDDIIVAQITPCFENGKISIVDLDGHSHGFATGSAFVLRPNTEVICPRYLLHTLRSGEFQYIGERNMRGTTGRKMIPRSFVESYRISLPPIHEQRKIVAILDKAGEVSAAAMLSNSKRTEFIRSIFLDMFGDSTVEQRYSRTTINDNIVVVSKGTTPMTHSMDFVSTGIPFLRVEDLVNNPITPSSVSKAIDESTHDFLSRSQLKPHDILISIAGTIGRISIVPEDSPEMNCNQAVAFVRLSETSVLRHCYLMHWLNTRDAKVQMAGSSVTATISNLSLGKIKELRVPAPPIVSQLQFERVCNEFYSTPKHEERCENLVGSIRQEMLKLLMTR